MASPFQTAQAIYLALKDDQEAQARIRNELACLAESIAIDPDKSFELTSSTVNGQSFAGSRTMTNVDRLTLLRLVVAMFDNGSVASTRTRPIF